MFMNTLTIIKCNTRMRILTKTSIIFPINTIHTNNIKTISNINIINTRTFTNTLNPLLAVGTINFNSKYPTWQILEAEAEAEGEISEAEGDSTTIMPTNTLDIMRNQSGNKKGKIKSTIINGNNSNPREVPHLHLKALKISRALKKICKIFHSNQKNSQKW